MSLLYLIGEGWPHWSVLALAALVVGFFLLPVAECWLARDAVTGPKLTTAEEQAVARNIREAQIRVVYGLDDGDLFSVGNLERILEIAIIDTLAIGNSVERNALLMDLVGAVDVMVRGHDDP